MQGILSIEINSILTCNQLNLCFAIDLIHVCNLLNLYLQSTYVTERISTPCNLNTCFSPLLGCIHLASYRCPNSSSSALSKLCKNPAQVPYMLMIVPLPLVIYVGMHYLLQTSHITYTVLKNTRIKLATTVSKS